MNELTEHQREILIAMLQGKNIEQQEGVRYPSMQPMWSISDERTTIYLLFAAPENIRIAPGQDGNTVRLYGMIYKTGDNNYIGSGFTSVYDDDTHYIDINPETSMIIGGKL